MTFCKQYQQVSKLSYAGVHRETRRKCVTAPQNEGRFVTLKKRTQYRCFPVNIAKLLRAPILKNVCKRLLLIKVSFNFQWFIQFIPIQRKYSLNLQLPSNIIFEWLISILKTKHCMHTVYLQFLPIKLNSRGWNYLELILWFDICSRVQFFIFYEFQCTWNITWVI